MLKATSLAEVRDGNQASVSRARGQWEQMGSESRQGPYGTAGHDQEIGSSDTAQRSQGAVSSHGMF